VSKGLLMVNNFKPTMSKEESRLAKQMWGELTAVKESSDGVVKSLIEELKMGKERAV